jgi:putative FmdB family regulatory protein
MPIYRQKISLLQACGWGLILITNKLKYWREIMPIYEYNCEDCNYKFDRMVAAHKAQVKCPLCQGKVKKLMSSFSVGASHDIAGGIPAAAGPKMCTNC